MTTWITVCDTCKQEGWDPSKQQLTDGEILASKVELAAEGIENIKTRRVSCLMGCKNACNITIQADGKLNYTLGSFDPADTEANGIVDYAKLHAESETGQVPYREWPQAIKGHFVTRHPPLPKSE